MADEASLVEIPAGELAAEHIGRTLILDSVWGPSPAEIKNVRRDDVGTSISVMMRPWADRGPVPVMAHRKDDVVLFMVEEPAGGG